MWKLKFCSYNPRNKPKLGESSGTDLFLAPSQGPSDTLIQDFWPPELGGNQSLLLKPLICGTLLQQSQQTIINCGFPGGSDGKKICLQCRRPWFDPWVGKIPWRREWKPTPVFWPRESHGQRSLVGYSPQGRSQLSNGTAKLIQSVSGRKNVIEDQVRREQPRNDLLWFQ